MHSHFFDLLLDEISEGTKQMLEDIYNDSLMWESNDVIKARQVAAVGTIKTIGTTEYIKTNDGWRYHKKGNSKEKPDEEGPGRNTAPQKPTIQEGHQVIAPDGTKGKVESNDGQKAVISYIKDGVKKEAQVPSQKLEQRKQAGEIQHNANPSTLEDHHKEIASNMNAEGKSASQIVSTLKNSGVNEDEAMKHVVSLKDKQNGTTNSTTSDQGGAKKEKPTPDQAGQSTTDTTTEKVDEDHDTSVEHQAKETTDHAGYLKADKTANIDQSNMEAEGFSLKDDDLIAEPDEDEKDPETIEINKKFGAFSRQVRSVINGSMKSQLAYGKGGVGKAQPLYSKVLTPSGFKLMRDIQVNDIVVTPSGQAKVKAVYPQQGLRPIYELTFIDGRKVRCDIEHLWKVRDRTNYTDKLLSLKQIIDKGIRVGKEWRYGVPFLSKPIDQKSVTHTISPWFIGFILGDGSLTQRPGLTFACGERDKDFITSKINQVLAPFKKHCKYRSSADYGIVSIDKYDRNGFTVELDKLEMWGKKSWEKSIPKEYLTGSVEQRLELVQGLMDSDGYVMKSGCCILAMTSQQLILQLREVLLSLGCSYVLYKENDHHVNKGIGRMVYSLTFTLPQGLVPVTLPFKLMRYKQKSNYSKALSLVDIQYVGEEEAKCISLDDTEHLYITDDYIITHNTYTITKELQNAGKKPFVLGENMPGDDDYDYIKITGRVTAADMYKLFNQHNGKILLFDDCNSVFEDKNSLEMLKGVTDTSGDGTVTWGTGNAIKDDNGKTIPHSVKFTGKVIFASNKDLKAEGKKNKDIQALLTRGPSMDLSMTPQQTLKRIKSIAKNPKTGKLDNLKFEGTPNYTQADMKEVLAYLDKNKENEDLDLSVRTIGTLLGIQKEAKADGVDWTEDADYAVLKKAEEAKPITSKFDERKSRIDAAFGKCTNPDIRKSKLKLLVKAMGSGNVTSFEYVSDKKRPQQETTVASIQTKDEVKKAFESLIL